ncbi:MAG: TIGR00730 family Rossman fold protein [Verrucomicrobiia bacterium]
MSESSGENFNRENLNICVFCGANCGKNPVYKKAAEELAVSLVKRGIGIIYGGGNIGLMGILADTALKYGGSVTGVIPQSMVEKELAHKAVTRMRIVRTMSERKSLMIELSNGFIALPGGIGTYDELFEVITLKQLGFHSKPSGILNVNGYFDPFIDLIKNATDEGFLLSDIESLFITAETADALVSKLTDSIASRSAVLPMK